MSLATNVDAYLKENGITQIHLSNKAGITPNALSLSLSEKRKFTAEEYVNICIALEVPLGYFIDKKCER